MERTFVDIIFLGFGFSIWLYSFTGGYIPLILIIFPQKTQKNDEPSIDPPRTPLFITSQSPQLGLSYTNHGQGRKVCFKNGDSADDPAEVAAPLPKVSYGVCQRAPRNKPISFMDLWTLRPGSCMEWPFFRCCLNATKTIKAM